MIKELETKKTQTSLDIIEIVYPLYEVPFLFCNLALLKSNLDMDIFVINTVILCKVSSFVHTGIILAYITFFVVLKYFVFSQGTKFYGK